MTNNRNKCFWSRYWLVIVGLSLIIVSIIILGFVKYYLIDKEGWHITTTKEYIDFNYLLSSAFNNWFTPFIAIIAALLTFLAFYAQYKTNLDQYDRIDVLDDINKKQSFETIFFKLIENHHQLLDSVAFEFKTVEKAFDQNTYTAYDKEVVVNRKGISCLISFNELLNKEIQNKNLQNEAIVTSYNTLYTQYSSFLSHLIRNLYHFVKFIDEKEMPQSKICQFADGENEILIEKYKSKNINVESSRYEYLKILRAQLSSDLILILSLNAFTNQGSEFEFYIRKYRLLKNINLSTINQNIQDFLISRYPHIKKEVEQINNK